MHNQTNVVWQEMLGKCLAHPQYIVKPRDMEVRELLGASYKVPMPAYISLKDRKVNLAFMFAEAHWMLSGSNRLEDVTYYMKGYAKFSDDGLFLRGAYGPKIVDQLPYVVDTLLNDNDTRQAVLTIWRERPAPSKDIPCTVAMQFFIREGKLELIVTMRSNDIVLGYTYDVFSFSMVAKAVQLLLKERGLDVELGDLQVNPGSLHLYERHYKDAEKWLDSDVVDSVLEYEVNRINNPLIDSYSKLLVTLNLLAENCLEAKL